VLLQVRAKLDQSKHELTHGHTYTHPHTHTHTHTHTHIHNTHTCPQAPLSEEEKPEDDGLHAGDDSSSEDEQVVPHASELMRCACV